MSRKLQALQKIPEPSGQVRKLEVEAELTSRPKYGTIPEFGVVVLESRHAVNWSGPAWFNEDFNKLLFMVSGAMQFRTPDIKSYLHRDSLVHVVANAKHSFKDLPGKPVVVYVIHYREKILPTPLVAALRRQTIHHWRMTDSQSNAARLVRQDLQEMLFEQSIRREGWQALLISLLIRLAVRAIRVSERQPTVASRVLPEAGSSRLRVANHVAALATNFYRQQSLDEAAAKAGLSRRRFTELFRSLTGTSWRQYLLTLRLQHGARLLIETRRSVTEVMFECGFEDSSHFNHHFKSYFGRSPRAYRKEQFA